jgi:hypothetical protein
MSEFRAARSYQVLRGDLPFSRQPDKHHAAIAICHGPRGPPTPCELLYEPAYRAPLQLQSSCQLAVIYGTAPQNHQCVCFTCPDRLTAAGLLRPMQPKSADKRDQLLCQLVRFSRAAHKSSIMQLFDYTTIIPGVGRLFDKPNPLPIHTAQRCFDYVTV